MGRAVFGEPLLAHPAELGVHARSQPERIATTVNERSAPIISTICCPSEAHAPGWDDPVRRQSPRRFAIRLEDLMSVGRALAAPRAVMKLRTVRARYRVIFGAWHAVRDLRIDAWAYWRTFLRDVSVLACGFHRRHLLLPSAPVSGEGVPHRLWRLAP